MADAASPAQLYKRIVQELTAKKLERVPDQHFQTLSRALKLYTQDDGFASCPRTWFILFKIGCVDALHGMIAAGHSDLALPLGGRLSLPSSMNIDKVQSFFDAQKLVISEAAGVEHGEHAKLVNGNDHFQRLRKLGSGQGGKSVVEEVRSNVSGKLYARKSINRVKLWGHDTATLKQYSNEVKMLQRFKDHDHLIRIIGRYTDKKFFALLLEPVADQDLKAFMESGQLNEADKPVFRTYFGCLTSTLGYLHDNQILHKDVKPANVLLKNGRVILTDFGTAFDWSETTHSVTSSNLDDARTYRYSSPEVSAHKGFHRASDIWSLGIVFLEMITVLLGRRPSELDDFVQRHGTKHRHICDNMEAAMQWFGVLQGGTTDSFLVDNEPLAWVKPMLSMDHTSRPTASHLLETLSFYESGSYIGKCCLPDASDSESEVSFDYEQAQNDDTVKPPDSGPYQDVVRETLDMSGTNVYTQPWGYPSPNGYALPNGYPYEGTAGDVDQAIAEQVPRHTSMRQIAVSTSEQLTQSRSRTKSSKTVVDGSGKQASKSQAKSTFSKDYFIRWLANSDGKLRGSDRQKRSAMSSKGTRIDASQRVGHFLSNLPDDGQFDQVDPESGDNDSSDMLRRAPKRRRSQETPLSGSYQAIGDEEEEGQFEEADLSRLPRAASEDDLRAAAEVRNQDMKRLGEELKQFNVSIPKPKEDVHATKSSKSQKTALNASIESRQSPSRLTKAHTSKPATTNPLETHLQDLRKPSSGKASLIEQLPKTVSSAKSRGTSRLEDYAAANTTSKIPEDASAREIWKRFQKNKPPEPPTTIMSSKTKSRLSIGAPGLRWNDKAYGYLPWYCARGSVEPVRRLLKGGCNPGFVDKPRWAPIYNTIKGASYRHTKCLRVLLDYGANPQAINKRGRMPLHYAIQQNPWPGYSTVVYTLLSAGADPNAKDPDGDPPLLALLNGVGKLDEYKREALILLLAPEFDTNLSIFAKGTLDSPLHLAVRRKDFHVVQAIIERLQIKKQDVNDLHRWNNTGQTPLLLAFSTITSSTSADYKIAAYLLEHGADANSKDATQGNTALHYIVRDTRNEAALLLLKKHKVKLVKNKHGKTPLDLAKERSGEDGADAWLRVVEKHFLHQPFSLIVPDHVSVSVRTPGKKVSVRGA